MSFLEALRFSNVVMQIPVPESILSDAQLKGRAQRLMLSKEGYKPARPLRAAEVVELEHGMVADLDPIDKYLLGWVHFACIQDHAGVMCNILTRFGLTDRN